MLQQPSGAYLFGVLWSLGRVIGMRVHDEVHPHMKNGISRTGIDVGFGVFTHNIHDVHNYLLTIL